MDNPTILVADGDPKNLQILRESLEASGFEVIVASDGLQAWQKISSDVPDLILSEVNLPKLDGFQLLEKLKADPVTSSIPLMFLTNRRELQDRVRSLRGGVKDYMIKPLHVKEVIARVRMILRRMERIREEEIESNRKLAGRLEEFSVIDLIENFGMERKTGILTLYNANNRSGEIYFRDGAVINASLGNLRAEKAVYQMLPWKRGHFTMTFKEINVPDEIAVSNLGLLLQGFKRMEERERMFKMLPSPETTFVTTETFRSIIQKRELTTDVAKFIALVDGKRDILQIIDESTYDDIKTLERLVKLYQQGFIKPSKTAMAGDEELGDIVTSIAEPKIMEQFGLGNNRGSKPVARQTPPVRPMPTPSTPTPASRPQISRVPESTPFMPSESNSKADFPKPSREPAKSLEPPISKFPPPPEVFDDEAGEISEAPIYLEPFGEDAPPEEPAPSLPDKSREVPDKIEYRPPAKIDLTARTGDAAEEEMPEPERLPIDLSALMQRPTAPPPVTVDKPAEPAPVSPPASPTPKVEAKIDKADEAPPTIKPATPTPPSPPSVPELEILDELIPPSASEKAAESERFDKPVAAPFFGAKPKETAPEPISEPIRETPEPEPIGAPLPEAKTEVIEIVSPTPEVVAPGEPVAPSPTMPLMDIPPVMPEAPSTSIPAMVTPQAFVPSPLPSEPVAPPAPEPPTSEPPVATPQAFVPSPLPSEPVAPPAPEPTTSEPPVVTPQAFVSAPVPSEPIAPPPAAPPKVEPQFIAPAPVAPPTPAPVAKPGYGEAITACLKQLLNSRPASQPKLVIIGREGAQVSPMVRHLLGSESSLRKMESAVFQYLEIGERKVETQPFEIIGISMEKQFSRLLDAAGADLIGCIVVVEAHRKEGLEYLSYLLNMLKTVYRRPLGIAVIKSAEQKNMATETLRDLLNLAPADFVQECMPVDRASVTEFLKGFTSEGNLQRWAPAERKEEGR
ncbi:response regulator [candidate division KSB1 bacterium]|nr:response regulator [candidate division KSB1 bacterium]